MGYRRGRVAVGAMMTGAALSALAACSTTPAKVAPSPAAAAPAVCADFNFSIYFEKGSEELTDAAKSEIGYAAARVKGCKLGLVTVLGLADQDGAARSNLILSRKRAQAVVKALAEDHLPAPKFDVEAIGEQGAVTPEGDPEPLRRRAEVVIHASPPVKS